MIYELFIILVVVWLIACLAFELLYCWWRMRGIDSGLVFDFRYFWKEYWQLVFMPITIPIYYFFVHGKDDQPKE